MTKIVTTKVWRCLGNGWRN